MWFIALIIKGGVVHYIAQKMEQYTVYNFIGLCTNCAVWHFQNFPLRRIWLTKVLKHCYSIVQHKKCFAVSRRLWNDHMVKYFLNIFIRCILIWSIKGAISSSSKEIMKNVHNLSMFLFITWLCTAYYIKLMDVVCMFIFNHAKYFLCIYIYSYAFFLWCLKSYIIVSNFSVGLTNCLSMTLTS